MPVKEQESNFKPFLNYCDFFGFANFDLRGNVTECALTCQFRPLIKKKSQCILIYHSSTLRTGNINVTQRFRLVQEY